MPHISEIRGQPHLSASSVNDYLDCGLLYKLSRIDKIQPEFKSDAMELGSAIHMTRISDTIRLPGRRSRVRLRGWAR